MEIINSFMIFLSTNFMEFKCLTNHVRTAHHISDLLYLFSSTHFGLKPKGYTLGGLFFHKS